MPRELDQVWNGHFKKRVCPNGRHAFICSYCNVSFSTQNSTRAKKHLVCDCSKCPPSVKKLFAPDVLKQSFAPKTKHGIAAVKSLSGATTSSSQDMEVVHIEADSDEEEYENSGFESQATANSTIMQNISTSHSELSEASIPITSKQKSAAPTPMSSNQRQITHYVDKVSTQEKKTLINNMLGLFMPPQVL